MSGLHVQRWGERGSPVLLVHGSVLGGEATWLQQRPLAGRFRLLVLDRRGYYPNPEVEGEDFEVDAGDVAGLLDEASPGGVHLVGHSYGGVVALLAAARRPAAVRSLTVVEPPAFGVAMDDAAVRATATRLREYWERGPRDPDAFLRGFLKLAGSDADPPSPLAPPLLRAARLLMEQRSTEEAHIPLDDLHAAPFPKLVVSGGHSAAFEAVCDALAAGLGAERAVVSGAGHSVPRTGAPFNDRLAGFMDRADWMATARAAAD